MQKKTALHTALEDAGLLVQYDKRVKHILSYRPILAWILKEAVEEVEEFSIQEIMDFIEPNIQVGSVPLELMDSRILGNNLESVEKNGEYVTFDLRFSVCVPDPLKGRKVKILINIEAQKKFYEKYSLVTRGIFYGTRMVSTQQGVEFTDSNYNDVKKVYSIWICLSAPLKVGNATTRYNFLQEKLRGNMQAEKQEYDKVTVVMICMNEKEKVQPGSVHYLLNVLFSNKMLMLYHKS